MILSNVTDNIQIVLSGAVTTNQLQCISIWKDINTSRFGRTVTNTNNTTDVNVVPAPAANHIRIVEMLSVYNNDTAASTVTIKYDANGTEYKFLTVTLYVGERIEFVKEQGFTIYDSSGKIKQANTGAPKSSIMLPGLSHNAALTGTKTLTSGTGFAVYIGKAPRALTSIQVRFRVTTLAATITWAEVAIARGAINPGGNPTLTPIGYADISAVINTIGQKTVTINVSAGQSISEGDDLWIIIGNQATTAGVLRALTIADDLQVGVQASLASRPSLNIGVTSSYTIEGATTLAPWIVGIV